MLIAQLGNAHPCSIAVSIFVDVLEKYIYKHIYKYGENNAANMLLLTHAAPFSEIRDAKPAASGLESMRWAVESIFDEICHEKSCSSHQMISSRKDFEMPN